MSAFRSPATAQQQPLPPGVAKVDKLHLNIIYKATELVITHHKKPIFNVSQFQFLVDMNFTQDTTVHLGTPVLRSIFRSPVLLAVTIIMYAGLATAGLVENGSLLHRVRTNRQVVKGTKTAQVVK